MNKIIFGLAGEIASGKGTIASYIMEKEKPCGSLRFSTILRDILKRIYVEENRDNLQKLSSILRASYGESVLSRALAQDANNDNHEIVVIDGIRRPSDMTYLKEIPGFKLIYVETDENIRYQRLILRKENADDSKKTFDEFQKEAQHESEQKIRELKTEANFVVNNNETKEELYKQIDEIILKLKA